MIRDVLRMGDPRLCPALRALAARLEQDRGALDMALERCGCIA